MVVYVQVNTLEHSVLKGVSIMPPSNKTFSVRIPPELRQELDQLATITERSRNKLVAEALEQYLELQRWQIETVRERLAEAESGDVEFIPHDVVMKRGEERLRAKLGL
jgi:RHH-type transcriptional regulator, rel operon repressor / antitoxin RelB